MPESEGTIENEVTPSPLEGGILTHGFLSNIKKSTPLGIVLDSGSIISPGKKT